MPSVKRSKTRARPPARKPTSARPARPASRPAPKKSTKPSSAPHPKPVAKPAPKPSRGGAEAPQELAVPLPGGRHHVLSLAFVRDGDEFLARLETDSGHITELKNRSLDQLLTLVAGELEDLLE